MVGDAYYRLGGGGRRMGRPASRATDGSAVARSEEIQTWPTAAHGALSSIAVVHGGQDQDQGGAGAGPGWPRGGRARLPAD